MTTGQIYWGAVPFVLIQVLMVGLIIAFPNLVSGGLATKEKIDIQNIQIEIPDRGEPHRPDPRPAPESTEQDDVQKALERSMSGDKADAPAPPERRRAGAENSRPTDGANAERKEARRAFRAARRAIRSRASRPSAVLVLRVYFFFCDIRSAAIMKLSNRFSAMLNHSTSSVRNFFHGS